MSFMIPKATEDTVTGILAGMLEEKGLLQGRIHITVFNDEKVIKWIDNEDGAIITKIIERMSKNQGIGTNS